MTSRDVFVIGGGPAGLAAAIAAAQRGLSVTVADRSRPPIDKACGEGIMPDGVLALRRLGVDLTQADSAPFHGIRLVDSAGEVSAPFVEGTGLGIRRVALHNLLTARAESLGIELLWGTSVESIRQREVTIAGMPTRSRYIVCADGINSPFRKTLGLTAARERRPRYGFRVHYRLPAWSRFVEVHWADCGQMYVTAVGPEDLCVVFITSDPRIRFEQALPSFPELHARLATHPFSRPVGGITGTRRLRSVVRGSIALIGDASGSADAVTGDGLSLAFQQAECLADAICRGNLQSYESAHLGIARLPRNMGELMLVMDDHPRLRHRAFRAFSRSPHIFGKLLAVHTRRISPLDLGLSDLVSFGWNLLRA